MCDPTLQDIVTWNEQGAASLRQGDIATALSKFLTAFRAYRRRTRSAIAMSAGACEEEAVEDFLYHQVFSSCLPKEGVLLSPLSLDEHTEAWKSLLIPLTIVLNAAFSNHMLAMRLPSGCGSMQSKLVKKAIQLYRLAGNLVHAAKHNKTRLCVRHKSNNNDTGNNRRCGVVLLDILLHTNLAHAYDLLEETVSCEDCYRQTAGLIVSLTRHENNVVLKALLEHALSRGHTIHASMAAAA